MRNQLLAFFLCLPGLANAQFRYDYPIVCDTTSEIVKSLGENWKETLTWTGKHTSDKSVYSLWTNEKVGAWTLLKMTSEISCILGTGSESKVNLGIPV